MRFLGRTHRGCGPLRVQLRARGQRVGIFLCVLEGKLSTSGNPFVCSERSPLADPWAVCLQPLIQWFPPAVHAPSTMHGAVPTRVQRTLKHTRNGPHELGVLTAHGGDPTSWPCAFNCIQRGPHSWALNWAWKDPHHSMRALNCAPRTPPVGHAPSTTHGVVVLTTRLCALNSHEGRPHSRAVRSKLGTERSPLVGHELSNGHGGVPTPGRVLSAAHTVVPTCGPCTLNCTRRGPHSRTACLQAHTERSPLALNWARRGPHLWCVRPRKRTDESLLAGQASSPSHGGVLTVEPRVLNRAGSGPHLRRAVRPQLPRRSPQWRAAPRQPRTEAHPGGSQPRT